MASYDSVFIWQDVETLVTMKCNWVLGYAYLFQYKKKEAWEMTKILLKIMIYTSVLKCFLYLNKPSQDFWENTSIYIHVRIPSNPSRVRARLSATRKHPTWGSPVPSLPMRPSIAAQTPSGWHARNRAFLRRPLPAEHPKCPVLGRAHCSQVAGGSNRCKQLTLRNRNTE